MSVSVLSLEKSRWQDHCPPWRKLDAMPHVASCKGSLQELWTAGQAQNLTAESASGKGHTAGQFNTATFELQQKPCRQVV